MSDMDKYKRVLEEREAIAVQIEKLGKALGETVNSQMTIATLRIVEEKMLLLKDVAAMIRARE
jgi:hypothetical protein